MEIYIDVEKLIQDLRDNAAEAFNAIVNTIIMSQPAADVVEIKHGEWEAVNEDWDVYECSVCQHEFMLTAGDPKDNGYNFCPNCGANMRGDTD